MSEVKHMNAEVTVNTTDISSMNHIEDSDEKPNKRLLFKGLKPNRTFEYQGIMVDEFILSKEVLDNASVRLTVEATAKIIWVKSGKLYNIVDNDGKTFVPIIYADCKIESKVRAEACRRRLMEKFAEVYNLQRDYKLTVVK